ncbi:MAG: orotate phosphoribosyltransferase, partial [Treponemataceae bacterium]|nr:orotate phosphoribosyltransferase [Treponemataceae bacterium]
KGEKSALAEITDLYGFPANAIVTMEEVVEVLCNKEIDGRIVIDDAIKSAIEAYYKEYGAKA